jgi:hypothetical protein
VDGQDYLARRITATNRFCFSSEAGARDFMDSKYPVGARVEVFYNPDHPQEAVLRGGEYSGFTYVIIAAQWLLALFLCLAGGWLLKGILHPLSGNTPLPGVTLRVRKKLSFSYKASQRADHEQAVDR